MHARGGQPGHLTLEGVRLAALLGVLLVAAAVFGASLQRYLAQTASVTASGMPDYAGDPHPDREAAFLRETVNMLAAKVGTLQARLASIDGLGKRVAEVAGVAYSDPELAQATVTHDEATDVMDDLFTDRQPPSAESAEALGRQLDELMVRMTQQSDNLRLLDVALTRRSADQARLPTTMPVVDFPYLSSSYGWRRDPFTRRYAMHEGLDFSAPVGTPILAAAGGVVLEASYQPGYGNMVEIDHGDGLISRYAHASSLKVKQGDLVERGQEVARVGSTGRSTGAHLHFEVRLAGQPLDPRLFLGAPKTAPPAVAHAQATASGSATATAPPADATQTR
ncbi:M23 family metallopeptidase [Bordetella genomosp. 13]|uniref:Peptidase M23 n=1 Tax=Bordetella genomosp. 13 TaxID=463040 RepID=A0A1W6ZJP8_9BORD|nr:M23 family metallopeptidase [Bordetella genomosp. 13]ARP97562.1 peptidase M23 [Bordetella genomosp. 13]